MVGLLLLFSCFSAVVRVVRHPIWYLIVNKETFNLFVHVGNCDYLSCIVD